MIARIFFLYVLTLVPLQSLHSTIQETNWLIVGAGPAGITALAVLLDNHVPAQEITWVDPEFNAGRLPVYANVPANVTVGDLVYYLGRSQTFEQTHSLTIDMLKARDPEEFPKLGALAEPLIAITKDLRARVNSIVGSLATITQHSNYWEICLDTQHTLYAQHVILATGSRPKRLDYPCCQIPLDEALDQPTLAKKLTPEDIVAVVGSSHSAILILKYLSEIPVKKVVNFYQRDLIYATPMDGWTLHGHSGLEGETALWAKTVLEVTPPANLVRIRSSHETLKDMLPTCTKVIYAIGYEANDLPLINGTTPITYDNTTGIIAPGLYGMGIAFPEKYIDPLGNVEYRVGVNAFMDFAQHIIPQWITGDVRRSRKEDKNNLPVVENY